MFKRIDRRRKRKEEEETLGLDEGERGVFGLHDTDSSESDTDSSESASASSSSSATSSDQHGTRSRNKRKRGSSSSSSSDESGGDEDGGLATDDEEVEDDQNSDRALNPTLTLTIRSALREPVRLIRLHPEAWVCAFCPGRILKHATMVKVHEASRIHRRRFKRAQEFAMEFSPDDEHAKVNEELAHLRRVDITVVQVERFYYFADEGGIRIGLNRAYVD
ncbi:hypothetical protein BC827DRAFT_371188 [Russula dissimulans]|nr:hypothetical protein BC827DRAFT_371188 [Russula dissimulans]